FVSQQQTVESHGGVASAVGGLCQHAALALEHMAAKTMKRATSVVGGVASRDYAAAKDLVTAAKLGSHLTAEECNDVLSIAEGAERSGVWPVVETECHQYMVLESNDGARLGYRPSFRRGGVSEDDIFEALHVP
ncbi:unnamed protein product, partial [Ectocarpus sp. 4 AP-2014]